MTRVVVNKCFGGFCLSPKAVLWMYEQGFKELATPIKDYFGVELNELEQSLEKWRLFPSLSFEIFSPDEQYVLNDRPTQRDHPLLVQAVEKFGEEANSRSASLAIVEIPDGVFWHIQNHDGMETVVENYRVFG